jgi:hypothetical protein
MAGIQRKIPHVETTNARGEIPLFMKHQGTQRVVSGGDGESCRGSWKYLAGVIKVQCGLRKEMARPEYPGGPFRS